MPPPSTPEPHAEPIAVSTRSGPESAGHGQQIPVVSPSTPVEQIQVPAPAPIPATENHGERQPAPGHSHSHSAAHQRSKPLGHHQPSHDQAKHLRVIAAQHEQAARTISLVHESNQNMHDLLAGLALESQRAAAAHGDSLRALQTAIQELRRAHQEILSRLNQPQGQ
jgi:hypothetical protein